MNAEEFYQLKNGGKPSEESFNDGELISPIYTVWLMEEYAKERAIAFLDWVWINNYTDDNDAFELYDIFNNENQEK